MTWHPQKRTCMFLHNNSVLHCNPSSDSNNPEAQPPCRSVRMRCRSVVRLLCMWLTASRAAASASTDSFPEPDDGDPQATNAASLNSMFVSGGLTVSIRVVGNIDMTSLLDQADEVPRPWWYQQARRSCCGQLRVLCSMPKVPAACSSFMRVDACVWRTSPWPMVSRVAADASTTKEACCRSEAGSSSGALRETGSQVACSADHRAAAGYSWRGCRWI